MTLPKSIKTFTLLASAIAGIIGSGWLLGPFIAAKHAGPAAIICWFIAGVLMIIVSGTFVILTRARPIVGGTVRFFQLSYGHFAGFSFSWIAWLAWIAVSPIETLALIQYSANYIPGLMTGGVHSTLTPLGMLIATGLIALITVINSYGISLYSKVNHIILSFKLLIPAITITLLFSHHFHAANFTAGGGFMPYGIQSIFSALPVAGVIYSFIGFNPEEREKKQDVVINLEIHYPADQACETDEVEQALNYKTITKQVISIVENGHFLLLEKLVAEILAVCHSHSSVNYAKARVDKTHALRFDDSVSLTLDWKKS